MANYKEELLTGQSWVRCKDIIISNPLEGTELNVVTAQALTPEVYFKEEKVVMLEGKKVVLGSSSCTAAFNPISGSIPLLNPQTGEPLGTSVSHAELYTILFSLYIQTALERDAA